MLSLFPTKNTLRIKNTLISLEKPIVMGILNLTPDSFYAQSRMKNQTESLHKTEKMLKDGATIIDIGAYSSRPQALNITLEEEIARLKGHIENIRKNFPEVIISIDTFRSEVAKVAIEEGATLLNDISGGEQDENMYQVAANYQLPYIIMHMKGTPQTMQTLHQYENMIPEICLYFQEKIEKLKALHIYDCILDVGFGFSKNIEQNYYLLHHLKVFQCLGYPVLVGISRKSMIYKKLKTTPEASINGTSILHTLALYKGASIIRVHDVKEAAETIKLMYD